MKSLTKHSLLIVLLIVLLSIGAAIYAKFRRERIAAQIAKIRLILSEDIGIDGVDIKTIIMETKPDASFDGLPVAITIYNAHRWYNDDEEAIYTALSNRTKAQLASIYQAFEIKYNTDLDSFLKSFLDIEVEYENIIRITKQAA
jgi:hypothetical protein